jgi:hypothetical protein
MKATTDTAVLTHRVGRFEFEVEADTRTPEVEQRWARRSEAIAAWLLAEWQREQAAQGQVATASELAERN